MFQEDLSVFFPDFGDKARIGDFGQERKINVIFDNAFMSMDVGFSPGITSTQPQITCKTVDVADVEQGTCVVVNNQSYSVADNHPDGTGMSILTLHRV